MPRPIVAGLILLFLAPDLSKAQTGCDGALIVETYDAFDSTQLDWRLASRVDRSSYDETKKKGGLNAVIYGVPVGANFDDFKKRVDTAMNETHESLSLTQFRNIAWTGLGKTGEHAYSKCLETTVLKAKGLHLSVAGATKTDVAIRVNWTPPTANDPIDLPLSWDGGAGMSNLPATVATGSATFVVLRPAQQRTLAVNAYGFSDSIVLEPLPPPPPPMPVCPPRLYSQVLSAEIDFLGADDYAQVLMNGKIVAGPFGFGQTERFSIKSELRRGETNKVDFLLANEKGPSALEANIYLNSCEPIPVHFSGVPEHTTRHKFVEIPLN